MGKASLVLLVLVFLFSFISSIAIVSAYFSETGSVASSGYNYERWTLTEDLHSKHRSMTLTHTWSSPSYSASFEQEGWGNTYWQPVVLNNQPSRGSENTFNNALKTFNSAQSGRAYSSSGYVSNNWFW